MVFFMKKLVIAILLSLISITNCNAEGSEWRINYCRSFSEFYGKTAASYSNYFKDGRDDYRLNSAKRNVDGLLKSIEDSFYEDRKSNPLFKVPGNTIRFETMHLLEKTMLINSLKFAYENPNWEFRDFRQKLYEECTK